jgi:hypothetical protein
LVALLSAGGIVGGSTTAPTWTADRDTLVVNGDNIDKGSQSIEGLDYWMALIPLAETAGGHLVVLVGDHEVEFLNDPNNSKAAALDAALTTESPWSTPGRGAIRFSSTATLSLKPATGGLRARPPHFSTAI